MRGGGRAGRAGGGAVVCLRGVRRGAVSRPFLAAELVRALDHSRQETVYVETDSEGYLSCGAGGGAGGGAAVCARAELAPHVHASDALLTAPAHLALSAAAAPHLLLQVRVERARAPHDELRLWAEERVLCAAHVPHLTPRNIRGEAEYACHVCGARFSEPNPLKVHLFLGCAPPDARLFWRAVGARLCALAAPAPAPDPARLEALAAEWGRAGAAGRAAHACVYCGKLYSRKYGLKIHIRTHTGYRPLRCRHCARAFGDPSNLNKHVRLHAARGDSPAPLRCPLCRKPLARRRDLERHLRTHPAPAPASASPHR